ncbi:MAG: signal peptide peptidase SppA [Bacteroidales bacterium]
MREFFKMMFASMVGFLLASFIFFFLMMVMLVSAISFAPKEDVQIASNSVLHVSFDLPIQDRAPRSPFDAFGTMGGKRPLGLNQILESIENAATDDRIKGIWLELGVMPSGMATVEEVRVALGEFRKSGKPVIAYGDMVSQSSYYLATAADKIYLNPVGNIQFSGLSAQVAFFKGLSEKLKVDMQIIRPEGNTFKSAVEPFYLDRMSEANREQTGKFLASGWSRMLKGIEEGRGLDQATLNLLADSLSAFKAEGALASGLVDGLLFKDQLLDSLRQIAGVNEKANIPMVTLAKYIRADQKSIDSDGKKEKGTFGNRIAVIYASGSIVMGDGEDMVISSNHISQTIRKAREDKKVKAIVLRVNSGGGDGVASEIIWREVDLAAKEKPVIVSMGDYAASGGYYIACAATKIVAQPNTLTGSIGVFGVMPNMQKLFSDHLGITFDEVSTNSNSSLGNVMRPLKPFEYQMLQRYVEDFYTHFVGRVADGRGMSPEAVDSIGQGRIWSGSDAQAIGLVDELGGLNDAIRIAADEAGLKNYRVVEWPLQKDPFLKLMQQLSGEASIETAIRKNLGQNYAWFEMLATLNELKGIQARLPFVMVIQ